MRGGRVARRQQPGEAWQRRRGKWVRHDVPEFTFSTLKAIAFLAAAMTRQDISPTSELCDTHLPAGERVAICLPPVVEPETISLSIRRPESHVAPIADAKSRYSIAEDWNDWARANRPRDLSRLLALYRDRDFEEFCTAAVLAQLNILLVGRMASSKTTWAKSMIAAIPHSERVVTIEDTKELVILQPNHVRLFYPKSDQSKIVRLLHALLRMRADRIILGELRDEAAWIFAQAAMMHRGSITTI